MVRKTDKPRIFVFSSIAIAKPKTIFSGMEASEKMTVIFSECIGSGSVKKSFS